MGTTDMEETREGCQVTPGPEQAGNWSSVTKRVYC